MNQEKVKRILLGQIREYLDGEITKEEYDHWRYNYPKFNVLNSDKETANE